MKKIMKKSVALLVGTLALAAFAGMAQAETRFAVQDTNAADKMVVTDTGYIGVGTNAPQVPVHIWGTNINDTKIISHYNGTTAGGGGNILMFHNNAANGLPAQYDRLGNVMFGSYVTNGTLGVAGAGISAFADGTWTNSTYPTYLSFQTTPASGARAERVRILGNGNVGIGTPSPTVKLQVDNGVRLTASITHPVCGSAYSGALWFTATAAGSKDLLEVCAKDANGAYGWRLLY